MNNTLEAENTTTETIETRIENINTNVSTIMQANLFLVAFIVVCVVCFLLYKAVDNFISY